MIIRKLFKFENAHIVRNCTTDRCKYNVHGHSYKVELFFESNYLDHGGMVLDFGLTKGVIKELIDSFDHAVTLWEGDDPDYLTSMKRHSARWVQLPVNPSAEQFARIFFLTTELALKSMDLCNGEKEVRVTSVIVHETDTGYAQAFFDDVYNEAMGALNPYHFHFSPQVQSEWSDPAMWERLLNNYR